MSDYNPDEATAREDLCRFLSACYYEPAAEFAEEKMFDAMLVAAKRVHTDLAEPAGKLADAFAALDLQTLLVDYTRLFLGPLQPFANPYGSAWLKTPVTTDETLSPAVLELYDASGFEIAEEFRDLPDHVAVELEFLYLLNFNKNRAIAADDTEKATAIALLQRRFLGEHLGVWIGPFAASVRAGAETDFYRALADFTERFVRMETAALPVH